MRASRYKAKARRGTLNIRDKWISGVFLVGVTVALWVQPAQTYSWMWNEAKDEGQQFVVGLLDVADSRFTDEWQVIKGGNQAIDLQKMIPGDARRLEATLSSGATDIDFRYKITAELVNEANPEAAEKLAQILRIRVDSGRENLFDGAISELVPYHPSSLLKQAATEGQSKKLKAAENDSDPAHAQSKLEFLHQRGEADKDIQITVYLPEEGVDYTYQSLAGKLLLKFEAKQATPGAVYAE